MSLIGITAGSAAINKPIMCNGANLAFQKKVFIEIGGIIMKIQIMQAVMTCLLWKVFIENIEREFIFLKIKMQ